MQLTQGWPPALRQKDWRGSCALHGLVQEAAQGAASGGWRRMIAGVAEEAEEQRGAQEQKTASAALVKEFVSKQPAWAQWQKQTHPAQCQGLGALYQQEAIQVAVLWGLRSMTHHGALGLLHCVEIHPDQQRE